MERGGATTQSGILYQNSITALYLGELVDASERLAKDEVVAVWVEAPEDVDDAVVNFPGNKLPIRLSKAAGRFATAINKSDWNGVFSQPGATKHLLTESAGEFDVPIAARYIRITRKTLGC